MQLLLRTVPGPIVVIEIPSNADLKDLRYAIEMAEGIPAGQQVLSRCSKILGFVGGFEHEAGDTISLSLALCGGGKKNQKGRRKQYITGGEEEAAASKSARQAEWNKRHGIEDGDEDKSAGSEEDEEEEEDEVEVVKPKAAKPKKSKKPVVLDQYGIPITDSEEETSSDEEEDESAAPLRPENVIEVSNPNRQPQKFKKASALDDEPEQLSRRERDELKRQAAERKYQKMHAAGKTEEARADLARLQLVRQQREEAAAKKKALEEAKKASKQR